MPKDKIRQWLRATEQQKLTEELESSQTGLLATALAGRCCSKTARVELRGLETLTFSLRRLRLAKGCAR